MIHALSPNRLVRTISVLTSPGKSMSLFILATWKLFETEAHLGLMPVELGNYLTKADSHHIRRWKQVIENLNLKRNVTRKDSESESLSNVRMEGRFMKERFVERFLVLSNRIIKTRSPQKIKHAIGRFPQSKAEMAQRMEGTCQLKVMYTLKPMHVKTVEKLCTQYLKDTYSS
ncbi:hypothetical protein MKW98_028368 [Papaver atlanticum]|uniref:Uncharacterized protein n=1 Tax=Papaver atlanticum TaxID=357466 RepID=A0AAD4XMH5_9MAGN|nr:hypothetical protein MKW98_028368 [Papaver atlanticum]